MKQGEYDFRQVRALIRTRVIAIRTLNMITSPEGSDPNAHYDSSMIAILNELSFSKKFLTTNLSVYFKNFSRKLLKKFFQKLFRLTPLFPKASFQKILATTTSMSLKAGMPHPNTLSL
jgi:hypothetical protein